MIHVPRDQVDERGRTVQPNQAWFERAEELTRDAIDEGPAHEVSEHYRHPEVRAALEQLFARKCAYCETRYTEPVWDVEHYRPKGAVAERPDHPGYYWLAYRWTNLYLACVYCNQRRKDPPMWGAGGAKPAQGKLDQFPIDDEDARAMGPDDDVGAELPYLLDPCADEPSLYLGYGPKGELYALEDDIFGSETIRICHLNRRRLRVARRQKIDRMRRLLRLRSLANAPAVIAEVRDMIESECSSKSPFAGLARALVDDPAAFGIAANY